ncbi:MAG: glutaredoxin family protein [Eubacteriales bacterium]
MSKKVVVYTSNTCPHCTSAKNFLKEKGVEFQEKNVSTDVEARSELMEMGFMGVPIILVDGETVEGFNKGKLEKLLEV